MKKTNLNNVAFEYILGCVSTDGYDKVLTTDKEKIDFVYECFNSEYWYAENKRYYKGNDRLAFANWLMGLPSSFNVDYQNYRILELAKEWGSIPADASEKQEDKIIEHWFGWITNKFFVLKNRLENKDYFIQPIAA